MCHHYDIRDDRDFEREREDAEDDRPSFANEESTVESEILTDGGDDEDAE